MSTEKFTILLAILSTVVFYGQQKNDIVIPNENLIAENIPEISKELASQVKKYSEARGASLADINPGKNEIVINTRFGATAQLHRVIQPLGDRTQITFFDEPIAGASYEPVKGKYLIYFLKIKVTL